MPKKEQLEKNPEKSLTQKEDRA